MDPEIQKQLFGEADARFWAIAGYQPGRKLDATNAIDKLMMPVWQAIYNEVLRQYHAGSLQWTMNHPDVAAAIATATGHVPTVEKALQAALDAPTGSPAHANALQTASASHNAAQVATKAAGAKVPVMAMAPAVAPVVNALVQSAKAVQQAVQTAPPPTVTDAHRVMQATAAPKHAADVAKAHGLNFQMDASGHGVLVAPGATQQPADLPAGGGGAPASGDGGDSGGGDAYHVGPKWTPLIAFGAVAAALGVGALIQNAAHRVRRPRRTRMSGGRMIVVR